MNPILLNEQPYEVIENVKEAFERELVIEKWTDYFEPFDYILGDFSYGKLRLKGFYESNQKETKSYNDIRSLQDYLKNSCAYGCKWFLLKKAEKK